MTCSHNSSVFLQNLFLPQNLEIKPTHKPILIWILTASFNLKFNG